MTTLAIGSNCMSCKYIRADYTCKAFPNGMPPDIANGFDHSFSVEGDGGVIYEPRTESDPTPEFDDASMQEYALSDAG